MIAEIPLAVVAAEIVGGKRGGAVGYGIEHQLGVVLLFTGDALGHDAESAVGELLDAPELFVGSCVGRYGGQFTVGGGCQGAVGSLDGDLEIGVAQIASLFGNGGDGPALVRTEHVVATTHGDVACGPCALHLVECLVGNGLRRLLVGLWSAEEATATGYVHAHEVDSQLKGIAATLTLNLEGAALELLATHGPVVLPEQGMDCQYAAASLVHVGLPVERHHLDALVDDGASEVSSTGLAVASGNDHLATTVVHVAAYIIDIGSLDALGAAHHDVIGGIDAIAAGAVGAQQVVPAIAVDEVGCLTVDGDVLLLVAAHAEAGSGIKLDETDGAEIGAIAGPQTTCGGVEQQTGVDGVLVFHSVGGTYLDSGTPLEVG